MIEEKNFMFLQSADDWKSLIRVGCDRLEQNNIVTDKYYDNVLEEIEKLGFYFIISKDVALVHISPGGNNLKTNLMMILLNKRVSFSPNENHKVKYCFFLTTISADDHMQILMEFAKTFSNKDFVKSLETVHSYQDYLEAYNKHFKK